MTQAQTQSARQDRLPPAIAGAALTAFAALYVIDKHFIGLPILGALLLLSYVTPWRLPAPRWYGYALRIVLFGVIVLVVGMPSDDSSFWYFKPEYTSLGGYLLAAELVVQTWRWRDWSQPPEAAGVALVLTALIMAAASNTFKHPQIQKFALLYTLLLILSLRTAVIAGTPPRRTLGLIALRALFVVLALAIGYGGVEAITRYDYRITALAMRLINASARPSEIGLSDAPQLGPVFNPKPSLDRVLIIKGRLSDPHLRGLAFDRYDTGQWGPELRERPFAAVDSSQLGADVPGDRARVTVLAEPANLVLAPLNSAGVDAPLAIDRDRDGVLQTHETPSTLDYQIVLPPRFDFQGPICAAPAPGLRRRLLSEPPELDPQVIDLAKRIAGDGDARSRIARLARDLRDTHAYSLTFTPHGEPLSDFILNHRAAHCEYFASAMVFLARAVGVPARFVTGYYAHERQGSQTVVRSRDAHAWAECWIDGTGWITVDATPSDGTPDALYRDPSRWRQWWEWIIDLPRLVRQWIAGANRRVIFALAAGAIGAGMLVNLARSLWLGRKHRRGRQRGYAVSDPKLATAARRFERALRRRGILIPPHRTWRESVSPAPQADVYLQFIAAYDAARFGQQHAAERVFDLLPEIEGRTRSRSSPARV
jgi:hypothetical protein